MHQLQVFFGYFYLLNIFFLALTRIYLFICILFSLFFLTTQLFYQLYEQFLYTDSDYLIKCTNNDSIQYWLTQIGFIRFLIKKKFI